MIVESELQFFFFLINIVLWEALIKHVLFATFSFGWVVGVKN